MDGDQAVDVGLNPAGGQILPNSEGRLRKRSDDRHEGEAPGCAADLGQVPDGYPRGQSMEQHHQVPYRPQ